jgi:sorbitol-specific phosphotransferase system component IIC
MWELGLVTGVPALEWAVTRRAMARMVVRMVTRMTRGRVTTPHTWLLSLLHRHHRL